MREGDDFDAFYANTSRRMVGQVYAMVGSLTDAEDAVQEAYSRAWQRWSKTGSSATAIDATTWPPGCALQRHLLNPQRSAIQKKTAVIRLSSSVVPQ
jgi:RNA polymerase sigma-70 factor (ECF subfamily)